MKKIIPIIFALLLAGNINAQDSKINEIRELMTTIGIDELCHGIINDLFSSYNLEEEEQIPGLMDTLNVVMDEAINDLMDSIVRIYDKVYTEDEIRQLTAFYQTPIGQRLIETMPLVSQLSMNAGRNWAEANMQKIQDRLAPLTGEQASGDLSYEDLYDPDEVFNEDNPAVVECSKRNNTKLTGSDPYEYSVRYNDKQWSVVPNNTINSLADLSFISQDQKVYALVIAEAPSITLQQLKAAALYNMDKATDNVVCESIGLRKVNGKEVLCMKISADVEGEACIYYNYYYSGDWGVLQFTIFAYKADFQYNEVMIEEMLSGLFVK
jgi:uncharacterized protein